jgi:tetratricopeptide (TPR) repeat protein
MGFFDKIKSIVLGDEKSNSSTPGFRKMEPHEYEGKQFAVLSDPEKKYATGKILFNLGIYDRAMKDFKAAVALDGSHADAFCYLADCQFCILGTMTPTQIQQLEVTHQTVIDTYLKAIQLNTSMMSSAYANLGVVYHESGLTLEGIKCLEKSVQLGNKQATQSLEKMRAQFAQKSKLS